MLTENSRKFKKPRWIERLNPGKDYHDYIKEDERRNGARRKKRMDEAKKAMDARKKKGVDISEKGLRPMAKWSL